MRQFINGESQMAANWIKGTDESYDVVCLDDDGVAINLTGLTVTMEVYTEVNKGGTNVSLTGTLGTVVGGHFTFAIADDQATISTQNVGTDLYMYAKIDNSGAITIADNPIVLQVL